MIKIENISSNLHWKKICSILIPKQIYRNSVTKLNSSPLQSMKISLLYSDISDNKLNSNEIIERVSQVPRNYWTNFVASVSAGISIKGLSDHSI